LIKGVPKGSTISMTACYSINLVIRFSQKNSASYNNDAPNQEIIYEKNTAFILLM
jgi:hypothetical protein